MREKSRREYSLSLQRFSFVISTDFSFYSDMLLPEVMWNTFRNKLLCAWWQKHDLMLEGYPKNFIISITSTFYKNDNYNGVYHGRSWFL